MGKKPKRDPPPKFATGGTWHTHHVILFDNLLNSPAYIALSSTAKKHTQFLCRSINVSYKRKCKQNKTKYQSRKYNQP